MTAPTFVIPTARLVRKRSIWWLVPGIAVLIAVGLLWRFRPWATGTPPQFSGQFVKVVPADMELKIVKDGELQTVNFTNIKSETGTTTQVLEVIKEGTTVKQGDIICTLDSSQLELRKEDCDDAVIKAQSALKIAQEMEEIQETQNAANKDAADVSLQLAQIALKEYEEGTYPQQLENGKTAVEMAQTTLKNRQEDLDQTRSLYDKGFVTGADVKKSELDVITARNELKKAETALHVLKTYQNAMDIATLKSSVAQARQKLARTIRENESLMLQRTIDVQQKQSSLNDLVKRAERLAEQIDACTIRAPQDGMLIYASTVDRNRDPVQDGASVHHSQWLFRLPDVRQMKAVITLNESEKVSVDDGRQHRALVSIVGIDRPIGATLTKVSVLPDNRTRWWNPDRRDYPCELLLDETPPGLKPGGRVERAEIFVDRLEQVLAVPLSSVYSVGTDSYVFVKEENGARERRVTLGAANDSHVQVKSGLEAGDEVLLLQPGQGRALLEKAGIKLNEASAEHGDSEDFARKNGKARPVDKTSDAGGLLGGRQKILPRSAAIHPTTRPAEAASAVRKT